MKWQQRHTLHCVHLSSFDNPSILIRWAWTNKSSTKYPCTRETDSKLLQYVIRIIFGRNENQHGLLRWNWLISDVITETIEMMKWRQRHTLRCVHWASFHNAQCTRLFLKMTQYNHWDVVHGWEHFEFFRKSYLTIQAHFSIIKDQEFDTVIHHWEI